MSFIFKSVIIAISFFLITKGELFAQSKVQSDNYEIQLPNFNSGAGIPSSSGYKLDSTIGQTAPGLFSSTGYRVKSGFQYIHTIIPFSFSISSINIDFGTLSPQTPVTRTNNLTVTAGGAGGYSVYSKENHPLRHTNQVTHIPDTLCDTGTCNQVTAYPWTQNSTYGFGFNVSGNDIPPDFLDNTYFRQFSDASVPETSQVVMSNINVGRSRQATVTYKVNVSAYQPAGLYQSIIEYQAIPSY